MLQFSVKMGFGEARTFLRLDALDVGFNFNFLRVHQTGAHDEYIYIEFKFIQ